MCPLKFRNMEHVDRETYRTSTQVAFKISGNCFFELHFKKYCSLLFKFQTRFRLINRVTGVEESVQYLTEAFFFLHTINAFEIDGHVVIDICCYKNAKMLDCMYIEALKVILNIFI